MMATRMAASPASPAPLPVLPIALAIDEDICGNAWVASFVMLPDMVPKRPVTTLMAAPRKPVWFALFLVAWFRRPSLAMASGVPVTLMSIVTSFPAIGILLPASAQRRDLHQPQDAGVFLLKLAGQAPASPAQRKHRLRLGQLERLGDNVSIGIDSSGNLPPPFEPPGKEGRTDR